MKKIVSLTVLFLYCLPLAAQRNIKTANAMVHAATQKAPIQAAKEAFPAALGTAAFGVSAAQTFSAAPYRLSPQAYPQPEYAELYKRINAHLHTANPPSAATRLYNERTREALIKPFPAPQPPFQLEDWQLFSRQDVAEYFALYTDMKAFHLYLVQKIAPTLSSFHPVQLHRMEKMQLEQDIAAMTARVQKQMAKMNSIDEALVRMLRDMNLAREVLFDLKGQLVTLEVKRDKPFDEATFRLLPPENVSPRFAVRDDKNLFSSAAALNTARELSAQLPPNLKVAVLNDDPANLRQYEKWKQAGAFSNGIEFTAFSSVDAFLSCAGKGRFDVILTDYYIPGGGGDYLVQTLRAQRDYTPVLFHSYAGGNTTAWQPARSLEFLRKRYQMGYDGYLPTNDDFFTSRGHLYVLEGLRNFFLTR